MLCSLPASFLNPGTRVKRAEENVLSPFPVEEKEADNVGGLLEIPQGVSSGSSPLSCPHHRCWSLGMCSVSSPG